MQTELTDPTSEHIRSRINALRLRLGNREDDMRQAARALAAVGAVWQSRVANGWSPPGEGTSYPWAMTRLSLEALLPGLRASPKMLPDSLPESNGKVVALILAGNTPLMSWSPLAACLLAGHSVYVKMSRDEIVWPRLFRDALADVDPAVADRVQLDVWPGDDPRTSALVRETDAVIAYGSDSTLDTLREAAPIGKPFFGYGHSVSVGLVLPDADLHQAARGFARDVLMYGQAGCLSAQAVFVRGDADAFGAELGSALASEADALSLAAVEDAGVARAVRNERDMALFVGAQAIGDEGLRWTVVRHIEPIPFEVVGHAVVAVIPISDIRELPALMGAMRGRIASVGVAGSLTDHKRQVLQSLGVSRICPAGEMQTPPLDWPNGNRDLLQDLLRL